MNASCQRVQATRPTFGRLPQSRNRFDVLEQRQSETIHLFLILHNEEGIVRCDRQLAIFCVRGGLTDITEEFDRRSEPSVHDHDDSNHSLDTPVVVVLRKQRMTEEETRIESAHVAIRDRMPVDDLLPDHLFARLGCLFLVNPTHVSIADQCSSVILTSRADANAKARSCRRSILSL